MHSAQRRAVLAILSMIEGGVRELRIILSDGGPTEPQASHKVPDGTISEPYKVPNAALSDEEDDTLEMMMEKHRLDLLRSSQTMLEQYFDEGDQ